MSYQQGYPQQQPQGDWQGGGYPTADGGSTSPVVAVIAAILGLAATAAFVVITTDFFNELEGISFGDLPGEMITIAILRIAAAALLLIGAIVVFFRKLPGAIILAFGGLVGIAAIVLYPLLLADYFPGLGFGSYLEELFTFNGAQATFGAIALIASPLALIFSILPPTLNYLKGSPASSYEGYPQQQGW
jgi:hypothetical protein